MMAVLTAPYQNCSLSTSPALLVSATVLQRLATVLASAFALMQLLLGT